jgi:hypothetical protein
MTRKPHKKEKPTFLIWDADRFDKWKNMSLKERKKYGIAKYE